MRIEYNWTDGNDGDFHKFFLKTEEYYSGIVGMHTLSVIEQLNILKHISPPPKIDRYRLV